MTLLGCFSNVILKDCYEFQKARAHQTRAVTDKMFKMRF